MNKPPYGDSLRKLGLQTKMFEVTAQVLPTKTVKIAPGTYWNNGTILQEYIGGNTSEILPPATGTNKWVIIVLNSTNTISALNGESSATSPILPTVLKNQLPLAAIFYKSTDTVITQDMIYDIRPIYNIDNSSEDKVTITTLATELENLNSNISNLLLNKSDVDGTTSSSFTLNKDETGAVTSDAFVTVNRLQESAVSIKWNETVDKWQYTNDGSTYFDFSNSGSFSNSNSTTIGVTKLSVDPVSALSPIAVGDNDSRLLSASEKTNIVNHLTSVNDPHNTLSLLTAANLPLHSHEVINSSTTVIGSSKLSVVPVDSLNPIAVGDNDTRLLSTSEKTSILDHVTSTNSDPHNTLSLLTAANLPVHSHSVIDASSLITGSVKLSLDPISAVSPIAVGDNDPRISSLLEKTNILNHINSINTDPHNTLSLLTAANLPVHSHTISYSNLDSSVTSAFVSSSDATDTLILTDKDIPSNKYRLEIKSGVLSITLI